MAGLDDLVKYMTERMVKYIETPKETRRERKLAERSGRENWSSRWFGMVPFALKMWLDKWRNKMKAR